MRDSTSWPYASTSRERWTQPLAPAGGSRSNLGTADDLLESVAVQPDGKILLAGMKGPASTTVGAVARLLPDGTLDPSFGVGGIQEIDQAAGNDVVNGVAVLSDGRIRLGGQCWPSAASGTASDLCVWGLTSAGQIDPSFNGGSYVGVDFDSGDEFGGALIATAADHLIVPGMTWGSDDFDFALVQLDAGGAPLGFKKVATDFSRARDECDCATVQSDGRILCAGATTNASGQTHFAAVRYNADGTLDSGFADGGRLAVDMGGSGGAAAVVVLPDGRIVLGGRGTQSGHTDSDFALLTLRPDGTPDATAGPGGRTYFDVAPGHDDEIHSMILDAHGRLLLYGWTSDASGSSIALVRVKLSFPPLE